MSVRSAPLSLSWLSLSAISATCEWKRRPARHLSAGMGCPWYNGPHVCLHASLFSSRAAYFLPQEIGSVSTLPSASWLSVHQAHCMYARPSHHPPDHLAPSPPFLYIQLKEALPLTTALFLSLLPQVGGIACSSCVQDRILRLPSVPRFRNRFDSSITLIYEIWWVFCLIYLLGSILWVLHRHMFMYLCNIFYSLRNARNHGHDLQHQQQLCISIGSPQPPAGTFRRPAPCLSALFYLLLHFHIQIDPCLLTFVVCASSSIVDISLFLALDMIASSSRSAYVYYLYVCKYSI